MRILITGIGGQDGSLLAELLCNKHEVHGIVRRSSCDNIFRVRPILGQITLHQGDLSDPLSIDDVIEKVRPEWLFNMADQDEVPFSFSTPAQSMDITAASVMRTLTSIHRWCPTCRVFQPVSATIFGDAPAPQDETFPFRPCSPYAIGKTAVVYVCRYFNKVHNANIVVGIMYNHDSLRRKQGYLLDKICDQAAEVMAGHREYFDLGDPSQVVDIGCAREFMQHLVRLMQQDCRGEYIFATGRGFSITRLVQEAMADYNKPAGFITSNVRPGPRQTHVGYQRKLTEATGCWNTRTALCMIKERMENRK